MQPGPPTPQNLAVALDEAYRDLASDVRHWLLKHGVRAADLSDMCHDVFLILNHRSDRLQEIGRVDLWLREVCRRAAAGYRRRGYNAREIPATDAALSVAFDRMTGESAAAAVSWSEDADRLPGALEQLDDESRDLLALHDAGELPLAELARLVDHDRKTVRKRLEMARRRLRHLLGSDKVNHRRLADGTPVTPPPEGPGYAGQLEILAITPNVTIGFYGNVVIALWSGVATLDAIDRLAKEGPKLIARCGRVGYLSVVGDVRPPPLPARKRIVRALDEMGPYVLGYATVLLVPAAWIVRPIMSGLVVLSRPRFPMRFFSSISGGADWLCAHYARGVNGRMASEDLQAAAGCLSGIRHGS